MLLLSLGVWFWRRVRQRRPASAPNIAFIIGADYRLVLFVVVVHAGTLRKAQHGPHRPDRFASACACVKVLAQAAEVMFRRNCEASEPCTWQRWLSGEPTRGSGMEKGTNEVLCCDGGRESQISSSP